MLISVLKQIHSYLDSPFCTLTAAVENKELGYHREEDSD